MIQLTREPDLLPKFSFLRRYYLNPKPYQQKYRNFFVSTFQSNQRNDPNNCIAQIWYKVKIGSKQIVQGSDIKE